MKTYRIFYAEYPIKPNEKPKWEDVEARNLEDAFQKMKDMHGTSIEIFRDQARKHYKE
jgi:hypothetical protein